jgi:hypothetical protein
MLQGLQIGVGLGLALPFGLFLGVALLAWVARRWL